MHANGVGIVFTVDSNVRSTSWHDVLTKKRGKTIEEYLISKQLHIAKEESCHRMLCASRGASNIDLTILNNQAISLIAECTGYWQVEISELHLKLH